MANSKSNKKNNSNPPNKSLDPPKLIENFLNEFTKRLKEVYHYEKSSESKDIPPLTMNLERDLVSPINKLKNYSRTDTPLPNLPIPYKENIKNPKKLRQEPRSTAILINNNQQHQITRSEEDLIHDIELIDNVKKLEKNKSVSKKSKSRSGINQPVNWLDKFRKLLPYSRYTSYYFSSMPKILLSTTKILVELDNHLVCIQFPKFTDRIWEKIIEKLSIHLLYESQLFSNQFGKLNDQDSLPNNLLSCLIPSTLEELEIKCNCQPGFQSEKKYCIHFRSAWEGIANHFWAKPCDLFLVWGRSVEEIVTAIHKERKKILIESALNNSVTVQNNEQSEELFTSYPNQATMLSNSIMHPYYPIIKPLTNNISPESFWGLDNKSYRDILQPEPSLDCPDPPNQCIVANVDMIALIRTIKKMVADEITSSALNQE